MQVTTPIASREALAQGPVPHTYLVTATEKVVQDLLRIQFVVSEAITYQVRPTKLNHPQYMEHILGKNCFDAQPCIFMEFCVTFILFSLCATCTPSQISCATWSTLLFCVHRDFKLHYIAKMRISDVFLGLGKVRGHNNIRFVRFVRLGGTKLMTTL